MPPFRLPALAVVLLATAIQPSPSPAQTRGAYLGELTWPDAERRIREAPVVIIPFGAGAKEHGPHLPMNSDAVVLERLSRLAVDSTEALVAPPILHGWFPAFRAFPGTEVSDPDVFMGFVHEVARSLARQGARRILFLNTGISRATGLPLSIVAREIRVEEGIPTLVVSWDDLETEEMGELAEQEAGGHADEIETSIQLVLQPRLVRMDAAVTDYGPATGPGGPGYAPGVFSRDPGDPGYSTTGLFGDPTKATREKGERALRILESSWLRAIGAFIRTPTAR